jgi:uncharacterized protein
MRYNSVLIASGLACLIILTRSLEAATSSGILHTSDNIPIAYTHYKNGFDSVVIICPGFYNSKKNRWMCKAVDMVSSEHDAIIFDFRGHGESGGRFTWSSKEYMDLAAILDFAKKQGYKKIDILAFSLGCIAALHEAAERQDINSMVLISAPSDFNRINFHFWEPGMLSDLKDNIECRWEGKGAKVANMFMAKPDPLKDIARIKNTPILIIEGTDDWVIKERHARKLYDAANDPKRLEIVKGGLHAERILQKYPEKMKELILGWFRSPAGY